MSDAGILILDANVLASFDSAGWFDSFAFWTSEWEMVTAERVWDEYAVEQDIEAPPEWLTVETIDLNRIHAPTIGQLSRQDWSCIGLLETAAMTKLVTNDSALKAIAEDRDHTVEWGTRFVIRTFQECGISTTEFEEGVDAYIEDVYLPDDVAEELKNTDKNN